MDLCRSKGVAIYRGPIPGLAELPPCEIVLGPPAYVPQPKKAGEKDPQARKRAHYMNLLGRDSIEDEELKMLPDSF